MDGFKTLPKMQHFKTGGSVKPKAMCYGGKAMKKGGEVDAADVKQDKAIVKKAFGMHDKQEHPGEKTDLSKLKKGGRAKKDCGTVRKYKTGGSVENVYGAKKKSGDLDRIEMTKDIKPGKAAAPSKAATKPAMKGSDVAKEKSKPAGSSKAKKVNDNAKMADAKSGAKNGPNKYKKGGDVKKFADGGMPLQKPGKPAGTVTADKKGGKIKKFQVGGSTGIMADLATLEEKRQLEKLRRAGQLGPAQQTELLNQPGGQAAAGVAPAIPANSALPPAAPAAMPQQDQMGAPTGMPMQKRGGKVKGKC